MPRLKLHFHWLDKRISSTFRSGVSLHSHTSYSREMLDVVPDYAYRPRMLSRSVQTLFSRYRDGVAPGLDLSRSPLFIPPISANEAFLIEATQIEEQLNLEALVSITDHDSVEAALQLRPFIDETKAPFSMEWTIPFLESAFHLGIHNLPSQGIHSLVQELIGARWRRCREAGASCGSTGMTRKRESIGASAVEDLLIHLNEQPQTLIVLNHPLRHSGGVGAEPQRALLAAFLGRFGGYIHAIEVNGLRPWAENLAVMDLADRWSLPVISGGDRHGCEPNAILNLTGQTSFQAFVKEIRVDRRSELVFMQQYREPLNLRKMRTAVDLLRESRLNHDPIPEALLQKPSV